MKSIVIITYPRSGANYLQSLIFQYSGQHIQFTHSIESPASIVIGIVRDPFESMHSAVVMRKHYNPDEGFNKTYNKQYIDIYNFLYKNANIVVDYQDIINFPDQVTKIICDILKFPKRSPRYQFSLSNNQDSSYLISSKTSPKYQEKHFDVENIQDCYEPYRKLLSKAIKLT